MKILSVAAIMFSGSLFLLAQEQALKPADVPSAVSAAAKQRFPHAQVSNWSKETEDGKTTYEASISDQSGKRDAVFEDNGDLAAIEQVVRLSDVPSAVKSAIRAKYPAATLRKAEMITKGKEIEYEVGLANAAKKEVLVSQAGKMLKEE